VYHDDPVARAPVLYVRFHDPAGDVDCAINAFSSLPTNALGIWTPNMPLVLNEYMQLVVSIPSLAAGQHGFAKYLSYEFDIGESISP
jgi:hypothetical protein